MQSAGLLPVSILDSLEVLMIARWQAEALVYKDQIGGSSPECLSYGKLIGIEWTDVDMVPARKRWCRLRGVVATGLRHGSCGAIIREESLHRRALAKCKTNDAYTYEATVLGVNELNSP